MTKIQKISHKTFKHHENITDIIKLTKLNEIFSDLTCYVSGGYPTALLFAPRTKESILQIHDNFYSDIDIFFNNKQDFYRAKAKLNKASARGLYVNLETTTENADTYTVIVRDKESLCLRQSYTLQLVKKVTGTPSEIISTFDLINSCVLYELQTSTWWMHVDYLASFTNKKLLLTNSVPLLDKENESYPDSIFFQLERLSKYATRYDLELDAKSLLRLIKLNQELPELSFEKNEKVIVRGYYSSYSKTITNTFHVWTAFSSLFTENIHWDKIKSFVSNLDNTFIEKEKELLPF